MNETALTIVPRRDLTAAPKNAVATVGNREISLMGYRTDLFFQHLKGHNGKQCSTSCAARHLLGRDSETNRTKIRRNLSRAFRAFLPIGEFLVIQHDKTDHGKAKFIKLLPQSSPSTEDLQYAISQVARMEAREGLAKELADQARTILAGSQVA